MHVIKVHMIRSQKANLKWCVLRSVLYCCCVFAVLTLSGSPFHRTAAATAKRRCCVLLSSFNILVQAQQYILVLVCIRYQKNIQKSPTVYAQQVHYNTYVLSIVIDVFAMTTLFDQLVCFQSQKHTVFYQYRHTNFAIYMWALMVFHNLLCSLYLHCQISIFLYCNCIHIAYFAIRNV